MYPHEQWDQFLENVVDFARGREQCQGDTQEQEPSKHLLMDAGFDMQR